LHRAPPDDAMQIEQRITTSLAWLEMSASAMLVTVPPEALGGLTGASVLDAAKAAPRNR
jgi:hypothetical protein